MAHIHTFQCCLLMSVNAVLQAARILCCECSACRLCSEGSLSHVLVFFSVVCACSLAGCSGLELSLQYVFCVLMAPVYTLLELVLMSVLAVLQAALFLSCESSVCRLCAGALIHTFQ